MNQCFIDKLAWKVDIKDINDFAVEATRFMGKIGEIDVLWYVKKDNLWFSEFTKINLRTPTLNINGAKAVFAVKLNVDDEHKFDKVASFTLGDLTKTMKVEGPHFAIIPAEFTMDEIQAALVQGSLLVQIKVS